MSSVCRNSTGRFGSIVHVCHLRIACGLSQMRFDKILRLFQLLQQLIERFLVVGWRRAFAQNPGDGFHMLLCLLQRRQ